MNGKRFTVSAGIEEILFDLDNEVCDSCLRFFIEGSDDGWWDGVSVLLCYKKKRILSEGKTTLVRCLTIFLYSLIKDWHKWYIYSFICMYHNERINIWNVKVQIVSKNFSRTSLNRKHRFRSWRSLILIFTKRRQIMVDFEIEEG